MNASGDSDCLIFELTANERFAYFIKEFSETGKIWIAESANSTLTLFDDSERELLPVWPSQQFLAKGLLPWQRDEGFKAVSVTFSKWRDKSTPALNRENVAVGVFPNLAQSCPVMSPDVFLRYLSKAHATASLQGTDLSKLSRKRRLRSSLNRAKID